MVAVPFSSPFAPGFDQAPARTPRAGLLATWRARRDDRIDHLIDAELDARARVDLRRRWTEAAERVGLGRMISTPLGGYSMAGLPLVEHIDPGAYGRPGYLVVRLRPGQLVADLEDRAAELAAGLGCWGVRFRPCDGDRVRVDLLAGDPLARTVRYPLHVDEPGLRVVFGVDETGVVVSRTLEDLTHMAIQGSNGAGKSAAAYNLLGQVPQLHAYGPLVDVCGIDPTGRLLGPWGEHPRGWRVNGTADATDRYAAVLRALVDDMDDRIAHLPPRCDRLPISAATPLRLVVLEELPGISRVTGYKTSGAPSEVQRLIARLASEGRKAGYRLLVIGQRLGSDVLGTDVRDQLLTRFTFGCRDLATLRMLSPDATPEDLTPLAASPPGVALADMPGLPMTRIRVPWVGGYGAYCDLVAGAGSAAA